MLSDQRLNDIRRDIAVFDGNAADLLGAKAHGRDPVRPAMDLVFAMMTKNWVGYSGDLLAEVTALRASIARLSAAARAVCDHGRCGADAGQYDAAVRRLREVLASVTDAFGPG